MLYQCSYFTCLEFTCRVTYLCVGKLQNIPVDDQLNSNLVWYHSMSSVLTQFLEMRQVTRVWRGLGSVSSYHPGPSPVGVPS